MIAIDSNILIYAHRAAAPQHVAARMSLERAFANPRGCGIALPSLAEFWSMVTHPITPKPSTASQAAKFIRSLIQDAHVSIWTAGDGFGERLLSRATDLAVAGGRIFDLQIALIAIENGAEEIWTHDRNFINIPGLRIYDPLSQSR
jgi:toxin-antitoxin system PIN domain toxin